MFSKTCEYGLRAVIFIAQQSELNTKVSIAKISEEIDSPQAFTAKILQQLSKHKIVQATKGPYGGFFIEKKELSTTALSDVVEILDSNAIYTKCGLGLHQCNENKPCHLHFKFVEIRNNLKKMLENTTLSEIMIANNLADYYLKT